MAGLRAMLCRGVVGLVVVCGVAAHGEEGEGLKTEEMKKAEAQKVFDDLFGAEMKRALATFTKKDDVALARSIYRASATARNQPYLMSVLSDAVYTLGVRHPDGYVVAIGAMKNLRRAVAARVDEANDKMLVLYKRRYTIAKGNDRQTIGKEYLRELVSVGDSAVVRDDEDRALDYYRQAQTLAVRVAPRDREKIKGKIDLVTHRKRSRERIEETMIAIRKDKADKEALDELLKLYVVELNDPVSMRRYSFLYPKEEVKLIRLASKHPMDLTAYECGLVGDWYKFKLSSASPIGRKSIMSRALVYYNRFLLLHTESDLARTRVKLSAAQFKTQLQKANGPMIKSRHLRRTDY